MKYYINYKFEDVNIWLEHLNNVAANRERGQAKAAETRSLKKKELRTETTPGGAATSTATTHRSSARSPNHSQAQSAPDIYTIQFICNWYALYVFQWYLHVYQDFAEKSFLSIFFMTTSRPSFAFTSPDLASSTIKDYIAIQVMAYFDFIKQTRTPKEKLHDAVKENNTDELQQLLDEGIDPNTALRKYGDNTPIQLAAILGYYRCVEVLIKAGGNCDQLNAFEISPLFNAARRDHRKLAP
ncbi:hypothetical protein MAR_028029 [Mya arenaria]|uniref:Uncharacterized protein n=1 Tax=Mya arenaria TaxID=6604 RepID=A0ABY7DCE4_MYAAR|nr:hypothetical protein MAR_028029 [Mya arenaria]